MKGPLNWMVAGVQVLPPSLVYRMAPSFRVAAPLFALAKETSENPFAGSACTCVQVMPPSELR